MSSLQECIKMYGLEDEDVEVEILENLSEEDYTKKLQNLKETIKSKKRELTVDEKEMLEESGLLDNFME